MRTGKHGIPRSTTGLLDWARLAYSLVLIGAAVAFTATIWQASQTTIILNMK